MWGIAACGCGPPFVVDMLLCPKEQALGLANTAKRAEQWYAGSALLQDFGRDA
jgi:hypothetical protein